MQQLQGLVDDPSISAIAPLRASSLLLRQLLPLQDWSSFLSGHIYISDNPSDSTRNDCVNLSTCCQIHTDARNMGGGKLT